MGLRTVSYTAAASLVAVLAVAAVAPAHAQSTAAAESLFLQGKALMKEGRIAEACDAFDGSYRQQASISTLLNLADCREKNGQYASAWGHFIEAKRQTRNVPGQDALFRTADDRSTRLFPRLSHLVIHVPDDARVEGLVITRNGSELDPSEWNREIPVDGGTYKIEGKAPGHESWSAEVTVGKEQDKQSVKLVPLRALPEGAVGGGAPVGPPPSAFTGKRKIAAGVGGAGVVAAAVGTVLYLQARGTYDDAKAARTNDARVALTDDANAQYLNAQIAWGVGAAAVGAAAFLWFTGGPPEGERAMTLAPQVAPGQAGIVLGGRF